MQFLFKRNLTVTTNAIQQLRKINPSAILRVSVDSGGCHGYQYNMQLTQEIESQDVVYENEGVKVIVDPISHDLIQGSKLDFVQELIGSSFQIVDNPLAESSCGCKTSFNLKTN